MHGMGRTSSRYSVGGGDLVWRREGLRASGAFQQPCPVRHRGSALPATWQEHYCVDQGIDVDIQDAATVKAGATGELLNWKRLVEPTASKAKQAVRKRIPLSQ